MKKFVFASVMAMASISLVFTPTMRAQDSTITIKDRAEFNAYQTANTQSDPKAKAEALESFLTTYPQSVVKNDVLDTLIDTYQQLQDADKTLSAASRLLQVDPNNMKAIFISVFVKKLQCAKTQDAQTCDDAAALAQKGLSVPKPADVADADWKKQTGGSYPLFHSAIALDDIGSKKDINAGIKEYRTELMLYPPEQTKSGPGWWDTLQLAEAYTKQEVIDAKAVREADLAAKAAASPDAKATALKDAKDAKDADGNDLVQAVWFYARAWNYATQFKPQIEAKMKYYYTKYHGNLDGLDAVKAQAAATVFPPGTFIISAAPTPVELAHGLVVDTPKLDVLALGDKEFILANGVKEDTDKLWAVLKDQVTPVPGIVIDAPVSAIKVFVTEGGRTSDYVVGLKAPVECKDIPETGTGVEAKKDFILSNGVKEDTDKIEALSPDSKRPVTRIVVDGTVSQIKVAVTQDMKAAKMADFIVNMKTPVACKEAPDAGFEYKMPSAGTSLVGIYDSFTQIPATAAMAQIAQIVLRAGEIQLETKKKPAGPAHKPAAGHRPAAH